MSTDRRRVARSRRVHWGRVASCTLACVSACASAKRSDRPAQEPASAYAMSKSSEESAAPRKGGAEQEVSAQRNDAVAPDYTRRVPIAKAPESPSGGAPVAPAAPPPAAAPAPEAPPRDEAIAPGAAAPHTPGGAARNRFVQARRELDIATSERDCARACRALESMERASNQVCDLVRSKEDRQACESTKEQVDNARTKVQNACGGCSGKPR